MNWYKTQSDIMPELIDTNSSSSVNYMRKNITKKIVDVKGNTQTIYEYDEIKVPKNEWLVFQQTLDNEANIDYIAMMLDVEL